MKVKTFITILFSSSLIIFNSCLDYDDNVPTAHGDAFVETTFLDNDSIGFNLQLYTYSIHEMQNVEVSHDEIETTFVLDTFDYKYTFAYQPINNATFLEMPPSGQYFFEVEFEDGSFYHASDYLLNTYIEPAKITTLDWDDTNKSLYFEWDNGDYQADHYHVLLKNQYGKTVFESELIEGDVNSFTIKHSTHKWLDDYKPTETQEYNILLIGYLFEPIATTLDIQCVAVNNKHCFIWNLEE